MDFSEAANFKILFVDDEINKIKSLKNRLKMYFDVDFEEDGKKALSLVHENKYAVIITDIHMPHMSGIELLEEAINIHPDTVGILITGNPDMDTAIAAVNKIKAFKYLTKPFRFNNLQQSIIAGIEKFKSISDLRQKSIRDSLTNLYNHKHIMHILEKEIQGKRGTNKKISILLLDIDNFKQINDTYGHRFGDKVLLSLSEKMLHNVRTIDSVGRYGGEEFLIIFPDTSLNKALVSAERIRKSIEMIEWEHKNLTITISGGLSDFENDDLNSFIIKADKLLYQAKRNGKNRIETYEK